MDEQKTFRELSATFRRRRPFLAEVEEPEPVVHLKPLPPAPVRREAVKNGLNGPTATNGGRQLAASVPSVVSVPLFCNPVLRIIILTLTESGNSRHHYISEIHVLYQKTCTWSK
jgi:hypothetical protein